MDILRKCSSSVLVLVIFIDVGLLTKVCREHKNVLLVYFFLCRGMGRGRVDADLALTYINEDECKCEE